MDYKIYDYWSQEKLKNIGVIGTPRTVDRLMEEVMVPCLAVLLGCMFILPRPSIDRKTGFFCSITFSKLS